MWQLFFPYSQGEARTSSRTILCPLFKYTPNEGMVRTQKTERHEKYIWHNNNWVNLLYHQNLGQLRGYLLVIFNNILYDVNIISRKKKTLISKI